MAFSDEHVKRVEERLQEYEEHLAADSFIQLDWCYVCDTVDGYDPDGECSGCLFYHKGQNCFNPDTGEVGQHATNKTQQWRQYRYLLSQLDKNGYEFKG